MTIRSPKRRAALKPGIKKADSLKEVLVLKHVPNEDAGTLLDFLEQNRIPVRSVDLYENAVLPERLDPIRAVLIMGGPMNVYQEDKYPFLKKENEFIKKLLRKNIPCLGICLGAQLIAKALGSKVYKAKQPEIGWMDITLSPAAKKDALFSHITAKNLRVLQWHGDTFDIPKGAVCLASSPVAPNQAYRYKKNVYAFQFHVEVNRPMLKDWFRDSKDLPLILSEHDSYENGLRQITDLMCENFFSLNEHLKEGA